MLLFFTYYRTTCRLSLLRPKKKILIPIENLNMKHVPPPKACRFCIFFNGYVKVLLRWDKHTDHITYTAFGKFVPKYYYQRRLEIKLSNQAHLYHRYEDTCASYINFQMLQLHSFGRPRLFSRYDLFHASISSLQKLQTDDILLYW